MFIFNLQLLKDTHLKAIHPKDIHKVILLRVILRKDTLLNSRACISNKVNIKTIADHPFVKLGESLITVPVSESILVASI